MSPAEERMEREISFLFDLYTLSKKKDTITSRCLGPLIIVHGTILRGVL
jgi:hypothetical protein